MALIVAFGIEPLESNAQCLVAELAPPTDPSSFGTSIAVAEDVLVVGDPVFSDSTGAVYVYRRNGFDWVQEAVLLAPQPEIGSLFGFEVAATRDLIVVGAPLGAGTVDASGVVFTFRYEEMAWHYDTKVLASNGGQGDEFGRSIAVEPGVLVVGAPRNDQAANNTGAVYVFQLLDGEWVEQAKLLDPEPNPGDLFGQSVALASNTLVVGSHVDGLTGAVFEYVRGPNGWAYYAIIRPVDLNPGDWFGYSVALGQSAELLVVGAPQASAQDGAAYVYRRADDQHWVQDAVLSPTSPVGPFPLFGWSLSIAAAEDFIVAGAPFDMTAGPDAGAAYFFRFTTEWSSGLKVVPQQVSAGDFFGGACAVNSDIATVGAPGDTFIPGTAFVFAGALANDCDKDGTPDTCDLFEGNADDANGNGVPDECESLGDVNGDGFVNVSDLVEIILNWGPCVVPCPPYCGADIDGDCDVNMFELQTVVSYWQ